MNCQDAEKAVLLAETGELPDGQRMKLDAHLAACPACSRYRAAGRQIVDLSRTGNRSERSWTGYSPPLRTGDRRAAC